jgi:hypothetical protein
MDEVDDALKVAFVEVFGPVRLADEPD